MGLPNKLFSIVLISCLGGLVYSNTFHCSFHFDDEWYIINNFAIRNIQNLQDIWKFYPCRFITFFSFALNYHVNGLDVFGYHLFNLMVHLLSAILVWWLTLLTLSTPAMKEDKITQHASLIALFAGLVFVSHPLQTEAVTYIWQRTASLAALFYLASLCFYIKSRQLQDSVKRPNTLGIVKVFSSTSEATKRSVNMVVSSQSIYYISSLITAVLAMFTKEMTVTLPLMILLYEFSFFKSDGNLNWSSHWRLVIIRKYLLPFFFILCIIPLTIILLPHAVRIREMQGVETGFNVISPMHYLFTQFRVMVTYIRLFFLPLNQNLDYDYPIFKSIFEIPVLSGFLFLTVILFFAQRLFLKHRLVSFSIFWFFLTMLPESSGIPLEDVIVEHRLYLPMVGYSIFLVSGMYYGIDLFCRHSERSEESKGILRSFTSFRMTMVVLVMIIACYSVLAYQRNKAWKDEITLWNDTIQKSPHKSRPYNNRGKAYLDQGNITQAMSDFNKAIDLDPKMEEAYNNCGVIYEEQGNFNKAMFDFNKVIGMNPNNIEAYINRGAIYAKQGHFTQAMFDFNKAIDINPKNEVAYGNRGLVYYQQNNLAQALSDYNKSVELNPNFADVYIKRGLFYSKQSDFTQAIADFTRAIAIDPKNAEVYNDRGSLYGEGKDFTQAIFDFTQAIEINPRYASAYYNRAGTYYLLKRYDKAWRDLHKAEDLGYAVDPGFVSALKKAAP